jgi:pyridoxamine 5'-phosphate oxidase
MMIQRPAHWGGYALIAHRIEFWQGQPSRLHDRISYHLENNNWIKQRLAP